MPIPFWTFLIAPLWIAGGIAGSIWYRRSKGKLIIPRLPADATFGERGCSGRSLRNLLSRFGGASNCLLVMVRDNRFTVTPQFPFNLLFLPEIYSLEFDVPVEKVTAITPVTRFFVKALRIEFAQSDPAPIELVVRDEDGLVKSIGRQLVSHGRRNIKSQSAVGKNRTFLFARVFLAIWGTVALLAALTGLQQDWRYRQEGVATLATYANPDPSLDQQAKMGVLIYNVAGVAYRLKSIRGIGLFKVGEQEKVYYQPSNPQDARQDSYFGFELLWLGLSSVTLSISIFGGFIARRIW